MTEPSVETAEGRAELRRFADREYSLEPDWYVPFQAALHAIDARDAALSACKAHVVELHMHLAAPHPWMSPNYDTSGAFAEARKIAKWNRERMDELNAALAEARAAERERIRSLVKSIQKEQTENAGWMAATDNVLAAIRALRDPGT